MVFPKLTAAVRSVGTAPGCEAAYGLFLAAGRLQSIGGDPRTDVGVSARLFVDRALAWRRSLQISGVTPSVSSTGHGGSAASLRI